MSSEHEPTRAVPPNFITSIIDEDLEQGTHTRVITRFPPEPNGYLHIGHAKSICLNFGLASDYAPAQCHLRFDDTNPLKESDEYVESIKRDVKWLGFDWGEHLYFASDYFEQMYQWAAELIRKDLAYVDSQNLEEIRAHRGTLTTPGTPSPHRTRSVEENIALFEGMRAGEFEDGAHVLRAKIDMAASNMLMRDPILYRIRHVSHHRTGATWCIYPMYDFAHCLEDAIEGITHSLCTLEFENNRELYDWLIDHVSVPHRPRQIEFARLNLDHTVMSKRKLLELVEEGHVQGWDDPRLPTIAGLRRRGVTPQAIRQLCALAGVAKSNSVLDYATLEFCVRDDLNAKAPRVLCVTDPLKVTLTNWPKDQEEEWLDAPYWPHDVPNQGQRKVPFSGTLYIERDDFMEEPPKGYFRLSPGAEVRLRHAYYITCQEVVRDTLGQVTELRCTYDPASRGGTDDGRKVKGTIHWVSAPHATPLELRLYDRLFAHPRPDAEGSFLEHLNPTSLHVQQGVVEPSLATALPGAHFQFERQGYFVVDQDSTPGHLVVNRVVSLKDSWARRTEDGNDDQVPIPQEKEVLRAKAETPPSDRVRPSKRSKTDERDKIRQKDPTLALAYTRFSQELALSQDDADILSGDRDLATFYEAALTATPPPQPQSLANWVVNELLRELKESPLDTLAFGPTAFGQMVGLVDAGTISSRGGKRMFEHLLSQGGKDATSLVDELGLRQVSDDGQILAIIDQVLAQNPGPLAQYRQGKESLLGLFIGKTLKASGGKADPQRTRALLVEKLSGTDPS